MRSTPRRRPACTMSSSTIRSSATTPTAVSRAAISAPLSSTALTGSISSTARCAPLPPTAARSAIPPATPIRRTIPTIRSSTRAHPWSPRSPPPLVAQFPVNGQNGTNLNHPLPPQGRSPPLVGPDQPPFHAGEGQPAAPAPGGKNFVHRLLATNPDAKILVAGDLNEFPSE